MKNVFCVQKVEVKSLWHMCSIVVGEFELHSYDYIHFWTNTFGKSINPLIPQPRI